MSKTIGFIFVLLSGVGFGFLGIFGRLAFQSGMSVGELLTFRFFMAAILLWASILIFRPKLVRLPFRQVLISIFLGVFGYAVFSTLYFRSIEGISVPLAALILFTFPIFVNLSAHFFLKERMHSHQTMSLVIACIGMAILLWGPIIVNSLSSVVSAFLAALCYSIYVLVSGKLQKKVPPLSSSLYVISASAIALFLFHGPDPVRLIEFSLKQKLIILGIAVVSTIGPLTLFLAGLQRMSSSKASIVVMIEPVVATVAAWLILSEQLTWLQLLGALMILAALVINAMK